jgi:16S rRNA (cytosine1402-N4)-methyltransferase
MSAPKHKSVLPSEILEWLRPQPGGVFVDGTLGGGGHSRAIAERVGSTGRVFSFDRDPVALQIAKENLTGLPVEFVHANFCDAPEELASLNVKLVDGILLDLGLSSDQLADETRGFSFEAEGPLDLRFNPLAGEPATRLVNRLSAEHLADLIFHYGEERFSRRIARAIVEQRHGNPIETSARLAEIVRRAIPAAAKQSQRIDPATRTFQALRIAVNDELKSLEIALRRLPELLKPEGRIAIISFHSLEDRRVKEAFRDDPRLNNLTKKPIIPHEAEIARNPRSRSAKLRVAEVRSSQRLAFSN